MPTSNFKKNSLILILFLFFLSLNTIAREVSGEVPHEASPDKSEYLPSLYGILKTKVEYDLDNSKMRFKVRNARFGARGNIYNYMSYRFKPKQFYSEIRLNYENYFKSSLPIHTDKFTIEFIGRF
jgi:hypothetical protein